MKKTLFFSAAALIALAMLSCQKDPSNNGGVNLETEKSSVASLYVVETGIQADPDGFNMITDGGFERENWKTNTLFWHPENIESSEEPCSGNNSIRLYNNGEGWFDLAIQTINVKKNQSYTFSLKYRGAWKGLNCYMGFRAAEGHDVCTNDPERNDAWDEGYSYTWDNLDDTQASVFFGGWWWYDLWVELDDVRVIPTGSSNDSFMPVNAKLVSSTLPAVVENLASAEKFVVSTSGKVGMLHNAVIDGQKVENAYVKCGFNKAGSLVIASVQATDIKDFVPTAIIDLNGKTYVHGYSGYSQGNPETETPDSINNSVILASSDGKTWEEVVSFGSDTKFAKVAFCQKDNYVYVFGSPIDGAAVNTYVARVEADKIADKSEYEYWDGGEYAKIEEVLAASVFYGPSDCMSVVYNSANYAFMAIYRSAATGQLVYRDAGLAEGEWSGEKLLIADEGDIHFYAPQIVVNQANRLIFVASAK